MKRKWVCFILVSLVIGIVSDGVLAADKYLNCRKFGPNVKIKIDGDPSDWPIKSYGNPATMPDILPEEMFADAATSNVLNLGVEALTTGDHFVFDPTKALISSGGRAAFEAIDPPSKTGYTTYIGWDASGLYVLNLAKDSSIGWANGQSESRDANNNPAWTNDGIELWFDNNNDRLPEDINADQTSETDLQLDISIDDAVSKEEFGNVLTQANGNPLEINIFRSALNTDDAAENAILAKITHVAKLDSKPVGEHESYVQEIFLPWKVFPEFNYDHPIGFTVNWMNWDAAQFILMRFHQAGESTVMYFPEMQFTSNSLLGETDVPEWSLF